MSIHPDHHRRTLPLFETTGIDAHQHRRSALTCRYRCGDACANEAPNTSDNEYFGDVVQRLITRRGMLRASAVVTAAGAAAAAAPTLAAADPASSASAGAGSGQTAAADTAWNRHHGGRTYPFGTNFAPVAPNTTDQVEVAEGYQQQVVLRWGDPVVPGAPDWDITHQSAHAQAMQFGYNNDFCELVDLPGWHRWLMVSNHEYTTEPNMFPGYDPDEPTREQVETAWEAHGQSVVLVERDWHSGELRPQLSERYNRRITLTTDFQLRGPAAGSQYLRTSADPQGRTVKGTFANCSGGKTPWGTILSGEENFNFSFANGAAITDASQRERAQRYGLVDGETTRKWERFDDRFDLAKQPNEFHRFGYVVEIDPHDNTSTPVKHTALGRMKHEACTIQVADDRRVVAYMGDDERFDYMYKFVSDGRMHYGHSSRARRENMKLLDSGTLYVAKFSGDSPESQIDGSGRLPSDGEFDGSGQWIPLVHNDRSFVPGMTAEEVYVFTRLAADKAGATKMDRPEDVQPNPRTGKVYAALTNNDDRGPAGKAPADEANPRTTNKNGHVLELTERGNDATATRFSWNLLLVCGDPAAADTYYGGYDKSQVSPISCPDNVAFDGFGNLWISTDGNELGSNDGLFAVPLEGPERGHVKQFLTVPRGAETCGPVIRDRMVLVSVQHPGEGKRANADEPASHWPDGGDSVPRPAVVAVWRSRWGRPGRIGF